MVTGALIIHDSTVYAAAAAAAASAFHLPHHLIAWGKAALVVVLLCTLTVRHCEFLRIGCEIPVTMDMSLSLSG